MKELEKRLETLREAYGAEDPHVRGTEYVLSTGNQELCAAQMKTLDGLKDKALAHAKRELVTEHSKLAPVQCLRISVAAAPGVREYGIAPAKYSVERVVRYELVHGDRAVAILPRSKIMLGEALIQALRELPSRPVCQDDWEMHLERTAFAAAQAKK